ncbi:MAG: hypothetical protein ACE367_21150 [Acidimicrobiales bacterium]
MAAHVAALQLVPVEGSGRGRLHAVGEQARGVGTGVGLSPDQPVDERVDCRIGSDELATHEVQPGDSDVLGGPGRDLGEVEAVGDGVDVEAFDEGVEVEAVGDGVDVESFDEGVEVEAVAMASMSSRR